MSDHTRVVRLSPEAAARRRHEPPDQGTCSLGDDGLEVLRNPHGARAMPVFNAWQGRMARTVQEVSERGAYLFALSNEGQLCGQVWLKADESLRSTSIGRHSQCELYLPDDERLALRQAQLFVRAGKSGPRCRLVDLRSESGFFGVDGTQLESVFFTGTAVFAIPSFWLVVVPTGQPIQWNTEASNAWRTLPSQTVVESRSWRTADELLDTGRDREGTIGSLGRLSAPGDRLLENDEAPQGQFVVEYGATGRLSSHVGDKALERGLLVGRYPRCFSQSGSMPMSLSRVHALVMRDEGQLFIADTGSTNGVHLHNKLVKTAPMEAGARFSLGYEVVVSWWPATGPR